MHYHLTFYKKYLSEKIYAVIISKNRYTIKYVRFNEFNPSDLKFLYDSQNIQQTILRGIKSNDTFIAFYPNINLKEARILLKIYG